MNRAEQSIARVKQQFFDKQAVLTPAQRTLYRQLSRLGAYVRTRARSSLRYRKSASPAGQPPSVHRVWRRPKVNKKTGAKTWQSVSQLREFLFFSYDAATKSVVIGPALLNGAKIYSGMTVPQLLEYGGTITVKGREMWVARKPGRDAKGRFVTAGKKLVIINGTMRYPARPFMVPALDAEWPRWLGSWKNAIVR